MKRITNIWLYFDPIYKLTKVFRVELKTLNTINSFIRKVNGYLTLIMINVIHQVFLYFISIR